MNKPTFSPQEKKLRNAGQQKRWRKAHKPLYAAAAKRWRTRNPEKVKQQHAKSWMPRLLRVYKLTPEAYAAFLHAQDYRCAICKSPLKRRKNHYGHIDYDHSTNQVRGILCLQCNEAIGLLQDRINLLIAATDYSRKSAL